MKKDIIEIDLTLGNIGQILKVYNEVFNDFLADESINEETREKYKQILLERITKGAD